MITYHALKSSGISEVDSDYKIDNGLLWIDCRDITDSELQCLESTFNLHQVTIESIKDPYRRPKLWEFPQYFYVNLTVLHKSQKLSRIKPAELHLFAGSNFIITVCKSSDAIAVVETLKDYSESPAMAERGPMYAVYLLAEYLIQSYVPVLDKLDAEADKLENAMLEMVDDSPLKKLYSYKRRVFELRRYLGPQRDIFSELVRRDFAFTNRDWQVYFQDIYNRMIRIFDMLDTIREILSSSLDIHLSNISNRLNLIMKVLTVISTIFMALSLVTGFFGMNFIHLPWLHSRFAFPGIMLFMALLTFVMLAIFRKMKWL